MQISLGCLSDNLGLRDKAILFFASGLLLGLIPLAPGTFGSLLGIPLQWSFRQFPIAIELGAILVFILISVYISGKAESLLGHTDPSQIVIDEVAGMTLALSGLPFTPLSIIAAFLLFRLFDIWKPFPINYIEKRFHRGWGIVMDDVAAGIIANLVLQTGYLIGHAW
jgi:phosphatidylglycerophosphatase A